MKFCMLCLNLVSRESDLVEHDRSRSLVCNVIHEDQLIFASDSDVRGSIRWLQGFKAAGLTKGEYKMREQAIGFTLQESSVLCDPELDEIVKPCTQFCHDWMHGLFSSGVWNVILLLLLLEGAVVDNDIWDQLDTYVARWHQPSHVTTQLCSDGIFSKKRVAAYKKAGHIKCPASDGLSLYPIVAVFVMTVVIPSGMCLHGCNAYIALCDVIEHR